MPHEDIKQKTIEYPNWHVNALYLIGDRVCYEGVIYRCIQNHTAQAARAPADSMSFWARVPEHTGD